ncbi:MAG: GxxExxY protein [Planctomycetes bacterium]|nr:GxxExxY protein [Planctomycetota bacterium]
MPVEIDSEIRVFSEDEFHTLAHRVMGIIFDIHNELGRLMQEEIYQQLIRRRCEAVGIVPARREVEICVSHKGFQKSYFMDLLFACGVMVETKTVAALGDAHHAQTLQYLMLADMHHGLLVNLSQDEVKKRFVSTTMDTTERRHVVVCDSQWHPINDFGRRLRDTFLGILADWGAFLQTSLYRETIVHLFGGRSAVVRRIPIYVDGAETGSHEVCLIAEDTAFAITAMKGDTSHMQDHLRRFLGHTRLACIEWINMDNHDVKFTTLVNRKTS